MKTRRQLSHEEHELWTHVTKSVKRLKLAPRKIAPAATAVAENLAAAETGKTAKAKITTAPVAAAKPVATKPALKPLVPLEPKTKRRLNRGQKDVAARIDLHGMRQHEAHDALRGFIIDAHANDARLVLVITGKGKTARGDGVMSEREVGVLRRMVPHWLSEPSLRHIVLGHEAATGRHGGEGALYVRIRKRSSA